MNKLVLGALVVIVLVAGGYFLLNNNGSNQTQTSDNQTQNASPTEAMKQEDANVTVDANGFNPKTLTVKAGTRVVWTNKSGGSANVSSDAHPTHLLFPFLNLGSFDDGSSVSVVFDKSGTYTYHNHLNASQTGT